MTSATVLAIVLVLNLFLNILGTFVSMDEIAERNTKADGHIIYTLRDLGFTMCARECKALSLCHGFNFNRQYLLCELLSDMKEEKRAAEGWFHARNTEWLQQKQLSIEMGSKECEKTQLKTKLSSGVIHCSKMELPVDCEDPLITTQDQTGGIYTVSPQRKKAFDVYCDFEASGGPWTVIQARVDDSVDFYRTWNDYKVGFGNLAGSFWLGNDNMHDLLSAKKYTLRVDIEYYDGAKYYAEYNTFLVAGEEDKYRLQIGGYSGTAGDGLQISNSKCFTTKDSDNDLHDNNCAVARKGGWWFAACYSGFLNGIYYNHGTLYSSQKNTGIHWRELRPSNQQIKRASMKVRNKSS